MTKMLVWLLISISTGNANKCTTVVLAVFDERANCEQLRSQIPNEYAEFKCVQAKVLVPK